MLFFPCTVLFRGKKSRNTLLNYKFMKEGISTIIRRRRFSDLSKPISRFLDLCTVCLFVFSTLRAPSPSKYVVVCLGPFIMLWIRPTMSMNQSSVYILPILLCVVSSLVGCIFHRSSIFFVVQKKERIYIRKWISSIVLPHFILFIFSSS